MLIGVRGFGHAAGFAALSVAMLGTVGCGGGGGSTNIPPPITLTVSLGNSTVIVPQDGVPVTIPVNIVAPTETTTFAISNVPGGVSAKFVPSESNPSGALTLTGSVNAAPGTYMPTITVSSSGQTASTSFSLISALVAKPGTSVDTSLGLHGELRQFMSTSFQIAEWSGDFFGTGAQATGREATLAGLGPQHIRMQALSEAIPMKANTGTATDWDFSLLDQTVQPILETGDNSPEFQVATAPGWMNDSNGHIEIDSHLDDFAVYAANLVRYYNTGGFDWGGRHFVSPNKHRITWWGIFNEPDYNGVSATDYVKLYNRVVPAMLAADPSIKLSALEFSGSTLGTGLSSDPEKYLPPFFATVSDGGVNTQVDVVSDHFYSSCNQKDTDDDLFNSVPDFVANLNYLSSEIGKRTDLAGVPIWLTENNVNADYSDASGKSTCNPSQLFVTDKRGTSAFFAAWRPYIFSQFGKAGNQALYHWAYFGDQQYGEVDPSSNTYLSYWVDKVLEETFPSTPTSPASQILTLSVTDTKSTETLATKNSDGSVVIMFVDRAVHASSDNNGGGDPRTLIVDSSELGTFSSGSLLVIDGSTNAMTGPTATSFIPSGRMPVTLNGYGMAILTMKP